MNIYLAGFDIANAWSDVVLRSMHDKYAITIVPDYSALEAAYLTHRANRGSALLIVSAIFLAYETERTTIVEAWLDDQDLGLRVLIIEDAASTMPRAHSERVLTVPADRCLVSSKLSILLGDLGALANQMWIKSAITAVLGDYGDEREQSSVSWPSPSRMVHQICKRTGAETVAVYLQRPLSSELVCEIDPSLLAVDRLPMSTLDSLVDFSRACRTYIFGADKRASRPFGRSAAIVVLSTSLLDDFPALIVYEFRDEQDEGTLAELCEFTSREIFHSLRDTRLRRRHNTLLALSKLIGPARSSQTAIWEALNLLKEYFKAQGASLVELVSTGEDKYRFRKTYTHHARRDIEEFETDHGYAVETILQNRALLILSTSETSTSPTGSGYSFPADSILLSEALAITIAAFRTPRTIEDESSVMYFPLLVSTDVHAAIKLSAFDYAKAFDLPDLLDLSLFAGPLAGLLLHRQVCDEIQEHTKGTAFQERISRQAETLFFYREIAQGVFHQLGNHLTALRSALDIIEGHLAGADQASDINTQLQAAVQYVKLSKELINDGHKRGLTLAPINQNALLIRDVVRPAIEYAEQRLTGTSIQLKHTLTSSDYSVQLDIKLAKEGLINILTNAIWAVKRHKEAGRREIFVAVREEAATRDVRIEITDSGIGMDKDIYARVATFSPFVSFREGGTGLGLYFTQRLLSHFGGRLSIPRSQPGKGTTVSVTIPISRGKAE